MKIIIMRYYKLFIVLLFLCSNRSVFANEYMPTYNNGVLTIPSVDITGKPGLFQEVTFKYSEQGQWQLQGGSVGAEIREIEKVELVKTESFPTQVFLKVSGTLPSSCDKDIGQIRTQLIENTFYIYIYFPNGELNCFSGFKPFSQIIPLSVYSLNKGEYLYNVNNAFTGSFALTEDNILE